MTEEEFLMSLPQDLSRDEKIKRLEEWRQKNPQPEVEEEVEEEVVEEPDQKSFFEPAPGSILSDDFSLNLSGRVGKKPISEMSLGEMQQELEPYQAQQAYKERIESVAKPNEVYDSFDNEFEYKYTIENNQPTYYSRPKGSDSDWKVHTQGDTSFLDIGGRVFNHYDYDKTAYEESQKLLNRAGSFEDQEGLYYQKRKAFFEGEQDYDKTNKLIEDYTKAKNLTTDAKFAATELLLDKYVYLSEEEEEEFNQQATNFINPSVGDDPELTEDEWMGIKLDQNGKVISKSLLEGSDYKFSDNEKWNETINKLVKAGTHSFDPSTGAIEKLDNKLNTSRYYEVQLENDTEAGKDREEIMNMASVQIAQEMYGDLGSTDQLDLNDPEVVDKIEERAIQIKQRQLENKQRKENLIDLLQMDRTDFDWSDAAIYGLESAFVPVTGFLDAVLGDLYDRKDLDDVFEKSQQNRNINKYFNIKKEQISEKSKNLKTFLANGENLIGNINSQQVALRNGNYQMPSQVAKANQLISDLNAEKKEIIDLMNEKWQELNEEIQKNPDLEGFIDASKRDYGYVPILVNNFQAGLANLGIGTANLVMEGFELMGSALDYTADLTGASKIALGTQSSLISPLYGTAYTLSRAFGDASDITEWKEKGNELAANWVKETFQDTIAENTSLEDLDTWEDYATWAMASTGQVGSQAAAMAVNPTAGLTIMVGSAMGNDYLENRNEVKDAKEALAKWEENKPKQQEGETKENYESRLKDYNATNPRPVVPVYNGLQLWGSAVTTGALEFTAGYFIKLPLAKGKSIVNPAFSRIKALSGNPQMRSAWGKKFGQSLTIGSEWVGDSALEGLEEVGINIGTGYYDRYIMGKDVNIFEGAWDTFAKGALGGPMFKSIGVFQPYLNNVQTPGDKLNIEGLQNDIKSIENTITMNPKMSKVTKDALMNDINNKIVDIGNSVTNSFNIYTKLDEADYNSLGQLDQQIHSTHKKIDAVINDPGIEVGKEELVEKLTNEANELSGKKNQILEKYTVTQDLEGMQSGKLVMPIIDMQKGADVVAEQLDSGIQRFDNTQDLLGGIESLKAQGVEVNAKTDDNGEILDAENQDYGLIATLPDGTKQIIVNEASSKADGVIPADKHEVLHLAASKMDPAKKVQMGTDLLNSLENDPNIEISDRVRSLLDSYKKDLDDGVISEADFYEEVMAVTSDGLTDGGVNIKDIGLFKSIGDKILQTIGWKQNFDDGMGVINFLMDFNADVIKGEGLSQEVLDEVDMGLETEVDLGTVRSKKLPAETETYMELDNEVLQQGLNDAIQNETDQRFPLAQAVVEKNWPLISKSLNINNQAEMDAAKEVVIDQVLGQFEGSGQGKYGPRNTSALAGFDLEGGAQVSTYLAETIRTRKPEIDAAIQDRTGGPGIQADQVSDVAAETVVTEVETTKPVPSETTIYSDAVLNNANTDKAGLEASITESITNAYDGRTDVSLAETRNIPQEVAEVYATAFGLNPETIVDKRRNFSKRDADGLNAAKRFLLANSQADYNRLPETTDAEGKGTFIPKNVKDALYTDGVLTGTLKDYQDIIRTQPEKPIYRDRVGQTIRGLLNTHIRNRILETANPDAATRQTTGATFSKKAPVVTKPKKPRVKQKTVSEITPAKAKQLVDVMAERDIKKVSESLKIKGREITDVNRPDRQVSLESSIEKNIPKPLFDLLNLAGFGRRKVDGVRVDLPLSGKPYYNKQDPAYKRAEIAAVKANDLYSPEVLDLFKKVKRIKIPKDGSKLTADQKKQNAEQEKINMDALAEFNKIINKGVQDGTIPMEDAAVLVTAAYQSTNGLIKIAIPFAAVSDVAGAAPRGKRKSKGEGFIEEHSPPVSSLGGAMLWGYANNASDLVMEGIRNNAVQVQLSNADDFKLDLAGLDAKLADGTSILTPNAGYIRLAAAGINLNTITDLKTGKPVAETLGLALPVEFYNNPDAVNYQNRLLVDVARGDLDIAEAKTRLKKSLPVQKSKKVQADDFAKNIGPEIVTPEMTAEQQKTVMVNSLKAKVLASKKTLKPQGISIFDFDQTVANTKEKVIVKMPDGSTSEISAAEFAREAGRLVEAGAEFDFSNFEDVAADTAEGPLADLVRKRQGKFGSGDIFILTARPNSAGPAIQQFLKSIKIDIPLSNITGLADGSPQAKVDFVLNKVAEGYNDFYFADDSFANVEAVGQILDAIDVKNKVEQALPKEVKLNNEFNKQLEEVTSVGKFKKYSDTRARLEGKKKDGGWIKRFIRQFTITPSADDFMGLMYALAGKGKQGNKHLKFIKDNLLDPYNKAELELLTAKVSVGRDFAALRQKFPSLKGSKLSLSNPLLKEIDGGPFNKEQAVRVYLWNKQGLDIPGMSKRDINKLVKAVEADPELNIFADELSLIQKGENYPPPSANWLGGSIKADILESMDKSFRSDLMSEFNENVDIIFSPENLNKIEAIYGSKYREALEDSIRRMKSGNNRPKLTGSGAGVVNEMLDWLNASVANVMFLNMRSGLLQTLSTVNFINWGDNNIVNASKAFASKEMWPTFMKLMNSDYLVNRRDGLKINVNEAELADAAKKGGIKGAFSYLLDKGFAITRVMDSFAIALGGSTFYINRKKALLNRINPDTGNKYTEVEAEKQAFEDFYAIAEETQQSSNPSKISSQQASIAGRLLLSFQNVTMQYNRKTKKAIQDLYNRRKKPGMTQRESDMSNLSNVVYYVGMQNLIFNGLQQGLFAMLFDEEEEEGAKDEKIARTINSMADSLLFGLGFGGAIVSTTKNILMRIDDEMDKDKPDYRDIPDDVFDVSSVVDAKYRKLKSAAKTFTFNRKEMKRRGWSIDNPAYLAVAQVISSITNAPVDRVLMKVNNLRQASDESVRMWQRVALTMGWSGWNFGLPYWGRQSTIDKEAKEDEKLKENHAKQVKEVKAKGFTKKIPLTGPNHYKPKGELGVDYMQVERPDGTIQYYVKHKKNKK